MTFSSASARWVLLLNLVEQHRGQVLILLLCRACRQGHRQPGRDKSLLLPRQSGPTEESAVPCRTRAYRERSRVAASSVHCCCRPCHGSGNSSGTPSLSAGQIKNFRTGTYKIAARFSPYREVHEQTKNAQVFQFRKWKVQKLCLSRSYGGHCRDDGVRAGQSFGLQPPEC